MILWLSVESSQPATLHIPNVPNLRFPGFEGEWDEQSLGEIAEISSGGTPSRSTPAFWNGKIPWITTSLINFNVIKEADEFITERGVKESSAKLFPKNTILMAMYGQGKTRGQVAILDIEAATNQACAAIMPKPNIIDYSFLFQNLSKRYDEIRELSNQGGQQNLSGGIIKGIKVLYPSIFEQSKIAELLSKIDTRIGTQSKIIEDLKVLKTNLARRIFSQSLKFLNDSKNSFPRWESKTLNEIGKFSGGGTPTSSRTDFWNGNIPWISSSDLSEDNIHSIKITRFVSEGAVANSATKLCNPPLILIVSRVSVGKVAYSEKALCTSQDFLNMHDFNCNGLFLTYLLSVEMKKAASNTQGTSIKGIATTEVKSKRILLPCVEEQLKIANFLHSLDKKIETESNLLEKMSMQKTFLLRNLFI